MGTVPLCFALGVTQSKRKNAFWGFFDARTPCPIGSCIRKKLRCEKFKSSTCRIRLVIFARSECVLGVFGIKKN
jgi:hypothetical protein